MREIVEIQTQKIIPPKDAILEAVGVPRSEKAGEKTEALLTEAVELYVNEAEPKGVYKDISIDRFASIYVGKGENEPETPLEGIYPKAEALALFAVTLGQPLSDKISTLFSAGDLALGYLLDAVASEGAELAADAVQEQYRSDLLASNRIEENTVLLRYSPGYCGWHMSGQENLFAYLQPAEIGITLNDSYLMIPLKSISGVIAAGERDIHLFKNNFPFCSQCAAKSCLDRFKQIKKE